MNNNASLSEEFLSAVIEMIEKDTPETMSRFHQAVHNYLIEKDDRYNATFEKFKKLTKSAKTDALDNRLKEIFETTENESFRQNALIGFEAVKNLPLILRLKQCEKQIMKSYDQRADLSL